MSEEPIERFPDINTRCGRCGTPVALTKRQVWKGWSHEDPDPADPALPLVCIYECLACNRPTAVEFKEGGDDSKELTPKTWAPAPRSPRPDVPEYNGTEFFSYRFEAWAAFEARRFRTALVIAVVGVAGVLTPLPTPVRLEQGVGLAARWSNSASLRAQAGEPSRSESKTSGTSGLIPSQRGCVDLPRTPLRRLSGGWTPSSDSRPNWSELATFRPGMSLSAPKPDPVRSKGLRRVAPRPGRPRG